MEILGIVLSLLGLMYFAYQGINVLILAPIMAVVAVLFHWGTPVLATYTQIFMPALGGYLLKYFPLFLLGAIFGKLMNESGAASSIGQFVAKGLGQQQAILATVLSCAILTYGGVSLFVVAFCIYPIAVSLFKEAHVPKRLIPAAIALGSFTFTMTALPGTPSIQNAIPMPYFGTTAFAAPLLGILGSIIMLGGGIWWLKGRSKKGQAQGEGYLPSETTEEESQEVSTSQRPSPLISFIPLILVIILNYVFSKLIFNQMDHAYLQNTLYGNISPEKVIGLWSIISALVISILVLIFCLKGFLANTIRTINKGTMESLLPIFNTASEVGYGATIASLSSFALIKAKILGVAPGYPLISEAISINILAGITGSASGGLSIALEALADSYLTLAHNLGLSPELLHRVATMSCGGFDSLPHNGAVITLLGICGLTHKKSYFDIFMVAVAFPLLATSAVVTLGSLLGSF